MKLTIVKDWRGQEEIHKAGCADLKKSKNRPYRLAEALTVDATTLEDVYRVYWECIDAEALENDQYSTLEEVWWAWRGEFTVKPCASSVPEMDEPGTATEPKLKTNGRRVANQELACWLVELVAANATDKTPAEQQKLANWLNSLPTGGGAGPDRYWPANFPRPDRSDWR